MARTAKIARGDALAKLVTKYLDAAEKLAALEAKADEAKNALRAAAADMYCAGEAQGVDMRTLDLPGVAPETGVKVVFKNQGKALKPGDAERLRAALGDEAATLLSNSTEIKITGGLAEWFEARFRDGVLIHRDTLQQYPKLSTGATVLESLLGHKALAITQATKPSDKFLETGLARFSALNEAQREALREIRTKYLNAPTVSVVRPKTPPPVVGEAADAPPPAPVVLAPPPPPPPPALPPPPTDVPPAPVAAGPHVADAE